MKISNEVKFGLIAVITIALILYGLNFMSGSKFFGSPLIVYAKYQDVQGLIEGNPVMVNGLRVGKVSQLVLEDMRTGVVTATLEITESLAVPDNSVAMIYNFDLLGSKGVKIFVPDSLPISEKYLKSGDNMKGLVEAGVFDEASDLVKTQGAQILIEVAKLSVKLNDIVRLTQNLLTDTENNNTLRETLDNIRETSDNLTSITRKVDSLAGEINGIASNAGSIVQNVENNNDNIEAIISNIRSTTDSLVKASDEVKALLTDASSAVSSVESMVAKLDTTSGTLGLLLNDTRLYDSLAVTTENINSVLREVKANPQRFFDDIKIYLIERKNPQARKPENETDPR
ncbi:MAG: MlaD family protein [Bacteroidia bacterium]|nr:MlaD family protein [Bacteroidia bacterium]